MSRGSGSVLYFLEAKKGEKKDARRKRKRKDPDNACSLLLLSQPLTEYRNRSFDALSLA